MKLTLERLSHASDGHTLGELWRAFCQEGGYESPDVSAWLAARVREVNANTLLGIMGFADSRVVGFVEGILFYEPATATNEAIIRSLYVPADLRRQGAGEQLARAIVSYAIERGAKAVLASGPVGSKFLQRVCPQASVVDTVWRAEV